MPPNGCLPAPSMEENTEVPAIDPLFDRPPTIADVARAASVSRTTISHALNGLGKVDLRTRERVKRLAAELGYRPDLRAQRLCRGQARAIALASSIPFAVAGGPSRLDFSMEVAAAVAERALVHASRWCWPLR